MKLNPIAMWQNAIVPPKSSISISPTYIEMHGLKDDCLMAVVFDYPDELCKRLFVLADITEMGLMYDLFNRKELHCNIDRNSNIIIEG